jgi:hypothetical protein
MVSEDSHEQLSTAELHDLAVRRARRHLDARFFWRLMEVLPVAEAGAGELREAEADVGWARIGAICALRACGESPVELGESEREAA